MSPLPAHLAQYATAFARASAETGLEALLIAAVCDRESAGGLALNPPGPAGLGDNGHGHGLMQIDGRSWAKWLGAAAWWDATTNICKGAEILNANFVRFQDFFDTPFLATCAYNMGPGNVRACLASLPSTATADEKRAALDARTTGHDYAKDVLARWKAFKQP